MHTQHRHGLAFERAGDLDPEQLLFAHSNLALQLQTAKKSTILSARISVPQLVE